MKSNRPEMEILRLSRDSVKNQRTRSYAWKIPLIHEKWTPETRRRKKWVNAGGHYMITPSITTFYSSI